MIVEQKECRVCGGELERVLDLGNIYPSAFLGDVDVSEDMKAPLILDRCKECGLVQLEHTIDLDLMYRQYWYSSSLNKSMVSSLSDIVSDIAKRVKLEPNDTVVDIGCNDGTMLEMYPDYLYRVGYDPARNIERSSGYTFINEYFDSKDYFDIYGQVKAKVITAIAMFYDLPDPNKFVEDVAAILANDGIFVVQFTDLMSMFKVCAFDNICHEHLEYYRLEDVVNLLRNHELDVIDVSYNDVNGGSVRITCCNEGAYPFHQRVFEALEAERKYFETYDFDTFKRCIETTKIKIQSFLKWAKEQDKTVYLLGASTKGNTLLQICGVTSEQVPYAAEVNKEKFGLRTVGSNIKIISEEEALIKHPDYFLVPVWHFKDSIVSNPRIMDYMKSNGRLIFPLPDFRVIHLDYNGIAKEVRI